MKENYSNQKVMFHLLICSYDYENTFVVSIKVWTYYIKGIRQNMTKRSLS